LFPIVDLEVILLVTGLLELLMGVLVRLFWLDANNLGFIFVVSIPGNIDRWFMLCTYKFLTLFLGDLKSIDF